jgi:Dolichyl-phosphate-mannose-protein mannosyltransferase
MDASMLPQPRTLRLRTWIAAHSRSLALLGTLACIVTSLSTSYVQMRSTLPYVQHIDERTLMRGAKRVLQDGGLNPRIYNYPSLPFYLTAAGLAWGTLHASGEGPEQLTVAKIGRVEPPYYEHLEVGAGARKLWLALGAGCVVAAAVLGNAIGGPVAMFLTALILSMVAIPMATAREYVNVDIPLALFVLILLAHLVRSAGSTTYRDRVWLPALLCGAAMASKYTGAVALVPALLALWLYPGPSRLSRSFELGALAFVVFLALCPRFVMDLPSFLDGMSYESFHYNYKGHKRFTIEPGYDQLAAYGVDVIDTFGWGIALLSVAGAVSLLGSAARRGAVLLSFPVCWVSMLLGAKVHFIRNLLPVMFCVAVLAARGIPAAWAYSGELARRWTQRRGARVDAVRFAVLAAIVASTLPYAKMRETHRKHTDSRVRFARWAEQNLPSGATLVIPEALPFATETLPDEVAVQRVDLRDAQATAAAAQPGAFMLVPHWTTDSGGVAARVAELAPGTEALPQHRVIREFPGTPAAPGMESELSVNPAFRFVRFEAE